MANIFLLNPRLCREDRLTANWSYLLEAVPSLGQRFTDWLSDRTGLPRTGFVTCIDHPAGTARDRPDFRLQARHWSIIFEHKLDARLGVAQMERYLEFVRADRRTFLALLAPRLVDVPKEVLRHQRYVNPKRHSNHFLWQQLFPLVSSTRGRLASDFAEYLRAEGVSPSSWGSIGDPFTDEIASTALREALADVAKKLRAPGRSCRVSPKAHGLQIRRPVPGIHLAYLSARPSIEEWDPRLLGRVFQLSVYVRRLTNRPKLSDAFGYLRGTTPQIFVNDANRQVRWDRTVYFERCYMISLNPVLGRSVSSASRQITEFVNACFKHLVGGGMLIDQDRSEWGAI